MKKLLIGLTMSAFSSTVLAAEETAPKLSVELNAAQAVEGACKLSFVLRNEMGADVSKFVAETVLFGEDGSVQMLTLFDFGALPEKRARVRQFQVPGEDCSGLGMVLLNGAQSCDGEGLSPEACEAALRLSSRIEIGLEG